MQSPWALSQSWSPWQSPEKQARPTGSKLCTGKWQLGFPNPEPPLPAVSWYREIMHVHRDACAKILLLHYYVTAKKKSKDKQKQEETI